MDDRKVFYLRSGVSEIAVIIEHLDSAILRGDWAATGVLASSIRRIADMIETTALDKEGAPAAGRASLIRPAT